ncbi:bifunctional indole-3-glycerol-phosphate synthase TrpC/phosphoribosylanthranilate isomerase TrpF [Enterovibrio paralichthyis]|uniref:bifunctional indole-3-glycerol-phosphate synthase TrpC/phosphoribosylanthranilate isomerase TrpF n=1 Tax=Enterovibrio paralichthyis TaxID=2853805 RepID=UPI001C43E514|nr:bifunctional indole-3-glycerol-phosphate synthase TrpC/phosphoribosylanthranilate isomerase TrpF [Enterovibrio paralichthyis]MBV7300163.1 bifunctional indole-3-glycerol-phosphate synthase TrpC/phosphoribosylanthranilate isomerase TrpF [Enterovibrio paralichthyis]
METVLAKIVADKKEWVAARKTAQPLDSFINEVEPSDRSFYDALSGKPAKFILECKKASPSKGLIRDDFDLNYIAGVYGNHAAAISVLTDEKYFQGNFDFLTVVRTQVPCPVLCKDFMIDTYQVYLARYHQADAILLMLSVLSDNEYRELADVAHSLKLGVLTEVSNDEELERAIALDAKVVGINNRNLRDLSIDLNRTKELAPRLPQDRIVISESGIYTHQQILELAPFANGFLIGSSLMAETDVEQAVRRVLYGDNKVCGLTRAEDAKAAYDAYANYGGLIFVEKSPRYVDLDAARKVMEGAPLQYVGVFQNHDVDQVADTAQTLNLAAVQLHGTEGADYIDELRKKLPENTQIWKAHGVSDQVPELLDNVDRTLLDSKVGNQSGGTGSTFDWSLIPDDRKDAIMIAGGLNSDNAKAAAELGCIGLDFNSGVEDMPGLKDKDKLDAAFSALRDY